MFALIDLLNLKFDKDGFEKEYEKVKNQEQLIFQINGGDRKAFELRWKALEQRKQEFADSIEIYSLQLLMEEKVLIEIRNELNKKENGKN